ncbi:unnamed protein product, partial [Ectocarpus sp. 12 AP-2014]
ESRVSGATAEFALGGSVERLARIPEKTTSLTQPRASLTLPLMPMNPTRRETNIGAMTVFADEGWDDGRDAFRLGTAYTQGVATAGVTLTYLEEGAELSRSEVFFDFALNQNFSVGVAGILDNDFADQDSAIPQLGLNAAYETEGGAFFQGEISEAESSVPLFGLSIGLRF